MRTGDIPDSLVEDSARTGATVIGAQRLTVELAARNGINPDHPRSLSRSVILA